MAQHSAARPVGRPREFDEEVVLEAAMEAFWRHGYEATSLTDLCKATGLHKGSLYQTFCDKHTLFMRALEHYADREFAQTLAVISESSSPLENLKAVVHKVWDDVSDDKGCLMTNSMVELAPHDPQVKELLRQAGEKRFGAMSELIAEAQASEEISSSRDPQSLARQLLVTLAGAATMVKGFMGREQMSAVLDELVDSWV